MRDGNDVGVGNRAVYLLAEEVTSLAISYKVQRPPHRIPRQIVSDLGLYLSSTHGFPITRLTYHPSYIRVPIL